MKPFEKAVKTLEFDKIRALLADVCAVEAGKEKILSLMPVSDPNELSRMQKETAAAKAIASIKGEPFLYAHPTTPDILDRAGKGALINPAELLRIASLLRAVERCASYGENLPPEAGELATIFHRLLPQKPLLHEIGRCIVSEDTIADDASVALSEIRRKKTHLAGRIRDSLQHYISGSYAKYLQENIITFRSSRYVIPVKSEYKNEIRGLIHDTSASGATVFIEPMVVVELNNQIKVLEGEEKEEIDRILAHLSAEVSQVSDALQLNFYNIVLLSVIFARAALAAQMDAREVVFSENGVLELERARHPLLDPKTVVPISLTLGGSFDTLVITGPNTGGKTVTLKTIGLFALMAQSGLQVPADVARLPILPDVLADIGDEQSIEQSLSTFSAHMKNIIEMLHSARPGVLMLFDELGSGTDPVEGAALAQAILEHARQKGVYLAATTHYAELKLYALETEGVENASCEFDVQTLRPTYRLILGTPGRSNAYLIAARLGLDEAIIDTAKGLMAKEDSRFENAVGNLEKERVMLEKERRTLADSLREAETLRNEAKAMHDSIVSAAQKEAQRAKKEALRLVKSARAVSDATFVKLEEMQKKALRERTKEDLESARSKLRLDLKGVEKRADALSVEEKTDDGDYTLPRPLKKGDTVIVASVGKEGTVESANDTEAVVLAGNMRLKISVKDLRLATKTAKKEKKKGAVSTSPRPMIQNSVDVRGLVCEDAWFAIDRYLDDVVRTGFETVTVIHGKGTGALKKGLWQYFRSDPRIQSFRLGLYGEGDGGVTILTMKM